MNSQQPSLYNLTNRLSAAVYANDWVRSIFGLVIVGLILLILFTDISNLWNALPIGIMLVYTHGIKKIYGSKELKR